jgi:hypothetical protein
MTDPKLALALLPDTFAICRLEPDSEIPRWACTGDFFSVTRTAEELSIVCPQQNVPAGIRHEGNWRCLGVKGPLDFGLTGILACLSMVLAQVGVGVFSLSTFDTDYLLVKDGEVAQATRALSEAGHHVLRQRTDS